MDKESRKRALDRLQHVPRDAYVTVVNRNSGSTLTTGLTSQDLQDLLAEEQKPDMFHDTWPAALRDIAIACIISVTLIVYWKMR